MSSGSKNPFDEFLELARGPWGEYFKDASRNVCDVMLTARKIAEQTLKDEKSTLANLIEIARLILLENQRLSNDERREPKND